MAWCVVCRGWRSRGCVVGCGVVCVTLGSVRELCYEGVEGSVAGYSWCVTRALCGAGGVFEW